ncbi:LPXTG-site transpeptidase (sortase) family protein [Actinophytocola oryzae]|uniref:LPXTG-site transpeptidase (Sortase) family protein n=1 Tax=Actinophytocola oryzae TaxID=502181 RepID=A0A4R7UZ64_9PSEU|nr:LPXTG-site transpeptidase (sortase) family protein [Actinophytocola oryzae]
MRRMAVPATVGAVLLAATVAVAAEPSTITGSPSASARAPVKRALVNATPSPLAAPTTPPAPPPPAAATPNPEAPRPQASNTVRLARGGEATLVRQEVVDGVLPVPAGVTQAAWWGAPFDGGAGASVLAGHVNWHGATGPFAELWQAKLGDVVSVVDGDGRPFRYRVAQLVTVHKNDLPGRAQELFGQEGAHRLVLVTCGGRWVGGHDGYEENRIVIAEPVA